jgi:hypothetical protein
MNVRLAAKGLVYYFGCVETAGHYMWDEHLRNVFDRVVPWEGIDGVLQPHKDGCKRQPYCGCGSMPEGQALIHRKNGWTALSFWDRSVDTRGGCNSTFFAKGTYTFAEMCELAQSVFPTIWNRYKFPVVLYSASPAKEAGHP